MWLFIPITERRGEADHSVMTKGTQGRTVTAAATSLTLRIPILEQRLAKATAKEFHRMADTFNVIRKPLAAIRTFGFVRHPYIVKGMAANESKEHLQTRFSRCMYAMDPHSQFLDTSKTRAKAEKANKVLEKAAKAARPRQSPQVLTYDVVRHRAVVQHCLDTAKLSRIYTLPSGTLNVIGLEAALGPQRVEKPKPSGRLQIEDDSGNDTDQKMFFKILRKDVGRGKVVRVPAAAGQRLGTHDTCIMMYKAKSVGDTTFVSVDPARQASSSKLVAVVDLLATSLPLIVEDFEVWSTDKKLHYGFGGYKMGEQQDHILKSMVDSGAFAGSDKWFVSSALDSDCNNVMEAPQSNESD